MKLTLLTSLLLGVAQAAPGLEVRQRPARCNADNCYRAVFGTRIAGQNARASADCSSFLGVVGSPGGSGPTTTTLTSTILTTVGTVSLTSDIVATEVSTLTISTTGTVTTTNVALTTQTPISTVSSDITLTTTVTVTSTLNAAKRDLDARVVTTSPTTTAVGGVPAYASYCSGTARFSSACACGLALGSNTLVLPSTTVTTVLTTTISTQVTTTIIASSTITNVETSTEIVGSTLTLSDTSTITAAPSLVTVPGSTITNTLTVTSFTTAPVVIGNGLNLCDGAFSFNGPGSGGCSSNCDCDLINVGANAGLAYCLITPVIQGDGCTTNAECPTGQFCDTELQACLDASTCTSTFVAPGK